MKAASRTSRVLKFAALTAAVTLLTVAPSCNNKGRTRGVPRIGALLPMTGPAATTGDQLRRAINLAVREHAAQNGTTAEVVVEDSRNNPATGVAGFRKLMTADGVDFIIVSLSGISQAVAPVANSEKVPAFALASAPLSVAHNDYMIRWFIDGAGEARLMADYLVSRGLRRIAVMHINDNYGRTLLEVFKSELKAKGLEPVSEEGFDARNEDFRSLCLKAKDANPDAVYFIAYGRPLGIALRQTMEADLRAPFFATFGFEIAGTRELASEAAEGLVYTSIAFGEGASTGTETKVFADKFREAYRMEPSADAALAYDLTTTLLTSELPKGSLRDWVGRKFRTQFGELTVSPSLEMLAPVVLKRIEEGRVSVINFE